MHASWRTWLRGAFALTIGTVSLSAVAQGTYPERAVKLVVPFAPGGSSDTTARLIADQLGAMWKQPIVVENKPGGNASIGASVVAKSPPDGYTLYFTPVSIGTVKIFVKKPSFDPAKDLVPVTQVASGDYLLSVGKSVPANTLAEFGAYARKNQDAVFHGAGAGGMLLVYEQFASLMNFKAQHVNYRGESPALTALAGGEVQAVLSTLTAARPFIESGRIKPLGIPAKERTAIAPDIKSADESGAKGFYIDYWFGLMAPAGTPQSVRDKVARDVAQVLAKKEVKDRLHGMGLVAKSSSAEDFAKLIQFETERWVDIAKRAGVEAQ
jgi:tripartite-type tricarboxylate transporter receptor subunit TctC